MLLVAPLHAQSNRVRVTGRVLDQQNAVPLPGVPVEVTASGEVAYTDIDGRYALDLPPGSHDLVVSLDGYEPQVVTVSVTAGQAPTVDVGLFMSGFAEQVTVQADLMDAETSTAQAQLIERKRSAVVSDNIGAAEMRANSDNTAASGIQRVTGLSVVGDGFVFVRGLGRG